MSHQRGLRTKARQPVAADIELGRRIRRRRLELGLSQSVLAGSLRISFQQLQKYEKGVNRVPAARLALIASALQLQPKDLFDTQLETHTSSVIAATDKQTLRLIRAYSRISNPAIRRRMVTLAEALSGVAK